MQFCPFCKNYLYLLAPEDKFVRTLKKGEGTDQDFAAGLGGFDESSEGYKRLFRICRTCGYREEDKKGGLVLETNLKEKTSEGYKILLHEFTKLDPTLPHVDTIKCPNETCASNAGSAKKDVIYLKYDAENLKFLYICNVCDTQWRSKGS
jgi:DNA-directed RNA polymerase subunit M/transcription elongation factor TFIIS